MYRSALILCALIPQILAGVFITDPVEGSSVTGGQTLTVQWKDDNKAPTLASVGPCEIGIFAGNSQQQTELQPISPGVDVSKQGSITFKVDPKIGPNADVYFIRFASLALKDTANPLFPYESFSSKFKLTNMSGQFSPAVQAQLNGLTSGSAGATISASAATSALTPTITPSKITTISSLPPTSKPSTSIPATSVPTKASAALTIHNNVGSLGVLLGVVTAIFVLSEL